MSIARIYPSEAGPFYASGPISFSSLRTNFKRTSSGSISASELKRDTDVNETQPIVPDCTENRTSGPLNDGISSSTNLKISQFRNSIKYYDLSQSGTDLNLDIANSSLWNSNLQYNIEKRVTLGGTMGSTNGSAAASLSASAVYNVLLIISGSILGTGGLGGSGGVRSTATAPTAGGNGGDALSINTNSTGTVTVRTSGSSSRVYGGGPGGGGGGYGGNGGGGSYQESYSYTESKGGSGRQNISGGQQYFDMCHNACRNSFGSSAYCAPNCYKLPWEGGCGCTCFSWQQGNQAECTCCYATVSGTRTVNTNGGVGADGGDGGNGEGYGQSRTFGEIGDTGTTGGGSGATNGGDGGDGGDGGTWGTTLPDVDGNGEDGESPANGTRTNATSGANGAAKGIAGRAVAGSGYTIDTANGVASAYKGLK